VFCDHWEVGRLKELAAFEVADGGSVIVELADSDPGYDRVARKPGQLVADTGKELASVLDVIRPTAEAVLAKVGALAEGPETVAVQFGIRLNAQVGAVLASTQVEGHLQVTLTWTNPHSSASNAG
jgi:hypothetical protein